MILSLDDVSLYAPSISLTGDELNGAIFFVQSIIESSAGCNRPIEITSYEIQRKINVKFQSFYLPYLPIIEITELQVRLLNLQDSFRRAIPSGEWFIVPNTNYEFSSNGSIELSLRRNFGNIYPVELNEPIYSEIKCNYTAGLDFSQDNDEIKKLKLAAIECLKYTLNSGAFKGVSELNVPFDEYRIKYSSDVKVGFIPDGLLLPFRKYRPVDRIS